MSLTRTHRVGYLRDIRRLTVALSRARLGLYVLGRRAVFETCHELREAFSRLLTNRPDKLMVVTGEMFGATSRLVHDDAQAIEITGVEHLGLYVYEMTKAKIGGSRTGADSLAITATPEYTMDGETNGDEYGNGEEFQPEELDEIE